MREYIYIYIYIVRGGRSKNSIEEANLGKHQQNVLGKILAILCKGRKTTMDEDSKDTNLLSASREPKPKEVGCKPRVKRVTWR